jgi:hypothetical protein
MRHVPVAERQPRETTNALRETTDPQEEDPV